MTEIELSKDPILINDQSVIAQCTCVLAGDNGRTALNYIILYYFNLRVPLGRRARFHIHLINY